MSYSRHLSFAFLAALFFSSSESRLALGGQGPNPDQKLIASDGGFAAPVVPNEAAVVDRRVGMIVYDLDDNRFKGLDSGGNFVAITPSPSSSAVLSGSTERVERASGTNNGSTCTISSQSGTWLTSPGTRNGAGDCTFSISGSPFSAAPDCVCSHTGTQTAGTCRVQSVSTSTLRLVSSYAGGSGANPQELDQPFSVICMGPQ